MMILKLGSREGQGYYCRKQYTDESNIVVTTVHCMSYHDVLQVHHKNTMIIGKYVYQIVLFIYYNPTNSMVCKYLLKCFPTVSYINNSLEFVLRVDPVFLMVVYRPCNTNTSTIHVNVQAIEFLLGQFNSILDIRLRCNLKSGQNTANFRIQIVELIRFNCRVL